MKRFIKDFIEKAKKSFFLSWEGKEKINVVIWYWGFAVYVVGFYTLHKLILINFIKFFDIILSLPAIIYLIWHIIVIRRCAPKKPKIDKKAEKEKYNKLSAAEKRKVKMQKRKELAQHRINKYILLREPIGGIKFSTTIIVVDLYFILVYLGYII